MCLLLAVLGTLEIFSDECDAAAAAAAAADDDDDEVNV